LHQGGHGSVISASRSLVAVADGLAVSPCAAHASRTALALLHAGFSSGLPLSEGLLRRVHSGMVEAAGRRCAGMACTLAAISVRDDRATIAHVGDCRVYRFRAGALERLTEDHTVLRRMILDGDIEAGAAAGLGAAFLDPDSALIADPIEDEFEVGLRDVVLLSDDVLMLTSDGITAALSDALIAQLLSHPMSTLPSRARALVDAAAANREHDDNLSVVLLGPG